MNAEIAPVLIYFIIIYMKKIKLSKQQIKEKYLNQHVKLNVSLKDAYGEIWHDKNDICLVSYINADGEGLMFGSELGVHYTDVDLIEWVVLNEKNKPLAYKLENKKPTIINAEEAITKLMMIFNIVKSVNENNVKTLNIMREILSE